VRWTKVFPLLIALASIPGVAAAAGDAGDTSGQEPFSIAPHFECGEYLVHGLLLLNGRHQFVLQIRDKSSSPYELLLGGGEVQSLLENQGTHVELKILVTKPIHDNKRALVVLESLTGTATFDGEKRKLRAAPCSSSP
jgi:hypothetical protein